MGTMVNVRGSCSCGHNGDSVERRPKQSQGDLVQVPGSHRLTEGLQANHHPSLSLSAWLQNGESTKTQSKSYLSCNFYLPGTAVGTVLYRYGLS